MPKRAGAESSLFDIVFQLALAVLVIWIVKMLLRIDPPFEDLLANVPWISVVFAAGALYMKVRHTSEDVSEIKRDLRDLRNKDLKELRDAVNQIKGKLKMP